MIRIKTQRMPRGYILRVRHIKAGDDGFHARNLPGFAAIDPLYEAIGNGAVQNLCVQRVLGNHILYEFRRTHDLLHGVRFLYGLPDTHVASS
ncbi:hypothetical protein SDC9_135758 [bioreactor metagenome]|uniref:Uncharacterized protein n=1 Tax=bioreactor metagenome TaxID=1076179 RepID=A0A645DGQ9_9ZZZZ